MDFIINDFSLEGQFATVTDFVEYMTCSVIKTFEQLAYTKSAILKSHNTFDCLVTKEKTLHDVLTHNSAGVSAIAKIKILLSKIIYEPFWNDAQKTDTSAQYSSDFFTTTNTANCLTEALERNAPVFSFQNQKFNNPELVIKKNAEQKSIKNVLNKQACLEILFESKSIDFVYFYKNHEETQGKPYEIIFEEGINEFFNSLDIHKTLQVKDYIIQLQMRGEALPRPLADTLRDGIHELRIQLSGTKHRILYFFDNRTDIVLTHVFIKDTQKVRESEIKKAINCRSDFLNRKLKRGI